MNEIIVTENAQARVAEIAGQRGNNALKLRIMVEGGGCSGFQYKMDWDAVRLEDDHIFGEAILIDEISLNYLKGSKVDFVKSLMGEEFKILNPNAVSGCGCGESFAV